MQLLSIGTYAVSNRVVLAPMAGVTDQPFRRLCREFGAGLAIAEMVSGDPALWWRKSSRLRMEPDGGDLPEWVQIVGADPAVMADGAAHYVERGAQIIDINMGCPAKKVCSKAAGSALLKEPERVEQILRSVVASVPVPVTLKMRTGWSEPARNGVAIASMAESCGIAALSVHGRTGEMRFTGDAEFDTIAEIKRRVSIPVIANGDIDSPERAQEVLRYTGADGVMVGRGALGRPWLIGDVAHYLEHGVRRAPPGLAARGRVVERHVEALHRFYGPAQGLRIARKHVGWYLEYEAGGSEARRQFNRITAAADQIEFVERYYARQTEDRNLAA